MSDYTEVDPKFFDSDIAKSVNGRVVVGKADGAQNFCMRVFELGNGGFTPRHSHEWEHEIFIHSGTGEAFRDGTWIPLRPGNVLYIPGNEEHQIRNTAENPFVFVCLIPSGYPEI